MKQIEEWQGALKQREDALTKLTSNFEKAKVDFQQMQDLKDQIAGGFAVPEKERLEDLQSQLQTCTKEEAARQHSCSVAEAQLERVSTARAEAEQELDRMHRIFNKERSFVEDKYEIGKQREQETNAQRIELANKRKREAETTLKNTNKLEKRKSKVMHRSVLPRQHHC